MSAIVTAPSLQPLAREERAALVADVWNLPLPSQEGAGVSGGNR